MIRKRYPARRWEGGMININDIPEHLRYVFGGIMIAFTIGTAVYARHVEVKYKTAKSPIDLTNLILGVVTYCLYASPYWYGIGIGIAALAILLVRNISIVKHLLAGGLLTLLMFVASIGLVWLIIFRFFFHSKRN